MVDGFSVKRLDETEFVDDARGVREQFTDPCSGFSMLGELELRAGEREDGLVTGHPGEALPGPNRIRQRFAVPLAQQRLVVEQIMLRGAAAHEQIDDALRLGGEG